MTQYQTEYQKLMENQRHNLEMEQLGQLEASVKSREAATKAAAQRDQEKRTQLEKDKFMFEVEKYGASQARQFTSDIKQAWSDFENRASSTVGTIIKYLFK